MPMPIILADEQTSFRTGAARVLRAADFEIAAEVSSAVELARALADHHGSVVLASLALLATTDREVEQQVEDAQRLGHRFILLTAGDLPRGPLWRKALHGAVGRNVSVAGLLDCVRRVSEGLRAPLRGPHDAEDGAGGRVLEQMTARELQMIGLVVRGQTNREVATRLGTTEQVVKNYLRGIFDKAGVSDRLELALFTLHHRTLAAAAAKAVQDAGI